MNATQTRSTVPTATVSHAAFLACRAAKDARTLGMTEEQAAKVYASAYADALKG